VREEPRNLPRIEDQPRGGDLGGLADVVMEAESDDTGDGVEVADGAVVDGDVTDCAESSVIPFNVRD